MPAELAVVVVSWNTRDLTLDALHALYDDILAHGPETDVWVVDNASSDRSADAIHEQFPQVNLLRSDTNLGFAGGNNHALRAMGFDGPPPRDAATLPRAVYLLNSDTRTRPGATRVLYDALFSLPKAGVVGAQLEYGDGTFQHGAFMFPGLRQLFVDLFPVPARWHDSRLNGRYPHALYRSGQPFRVDHTLGATMMLKREVIQETGMFDEAYLMYCEEIDWSIRIRRAGWEIYTVPGARVTHLAGKSTGQDRPRSIINLWRSRFRLYEKFYSPAKHALARMIVRVGMARRIAQTKRAFAAGELTADERDALIDAYRMVQTL